MNTEKQKNKLTTNEVWRLGWCSSAEGPSKKTIRHSRFTQKKIDEAAKKLNSMLKAIEGDSRMLQDTIDDLRKDLEVEKRSREELVNWINKADEIYWAKHKGTERQFIHANLMSDAWLEVEKEKKIKEVFEREQNRLGLDSA